MCQASLIVGGHFQQAPEFRYFGSSNRWTSLTSIGTADSPKFQSTAFQVIALKKFSTSDVRCVLDSVNCKLMLAHSVRYW